MKTSENREIKLSQISPLSPKIAKISVREIYGVYSITTEGYFHGPRGLHYNEVPLYLSRNYPLTSLLTEGVWQSKHV